MELGDWVWGWIIDNLDTRGSAVYLLLHIYQKNHTNQNTVYENQAKIRRMATK